MFKCVLIREEHNTIIILVNVHVHVHKPMMKIINEKLKNHNNEIIAMEFKTKNKNLKLKTANI